MGRNFTSVWVESEAGSTRLGAALGRLGRLVDWERRDRSAGSGRRMRQSVEPARDLLARLGSPQRSWKSVHVAGTKGKGSVASLVAAGLRRFGIAEGVYASPHVERIGERVRIGGADADADALAGALERALDARERGLAEGTGAGEATWFDVLTAAACVLFEDARVEWAVLECGLGGRLDSTTAVGSELAILTNVGLEHTAILGETRAAIAAEKAGIIRAGSIVVTGAGPPGDEAREVIARVAAERGARLVCVEPAGSIEERNVALAGVALDCLGSEIPGGEARDGAHLGAHLLDAATRAEARLPGRLERFRVGGVPLVLDGAHVPESLALVLRDAQRVLGLSGPALAVLGAGRDKQALGLLKVLAGGVDRVLCTSPGPGPYLAPQELAGAARRIGLAAEAVADPDEALDMALRIASENGGWVLLTGSLHLVGRLRGRVASAARTSAC